MAQWNNQSECCYIIITHAQETQLTKVDLSSPESKVKKFLRKALEHSFNTVKSRHVTDGGVTLSIWILKPKMRFYFGIWPSTHAGSSDNQSSGCYIIITRPHRKRQSILTKPPQTTAVENAFLSMIVYSFVFKLLQKHNSLIKLVAVLEIMMWGWPLFTFKNISHDSSSVNR